MKRRKNLERAVILGLLLSTSVYSSAWAEGRIFSDNVAKIVEAGDLVITDSMSALGFNGNVDVKNGDLIINTEGYDIANGIESGYLNNAKLNILAENVFINAGANGIITTWGDPGVDSNSFGNVIIGSEENTIQELKIESGGQGIDNKRGTVTIYGSDNSIIDIYSKHTSGDDDKQSAINVGSHHDTISDIDNIVILKGGSIKLKADGGDGITNGALSDDEKSRKDATINLISKEVTIEASIDGINNVAGTVTLDTTGNNIINAQQTAVHNSGSGAITISATAGTGDEGISTLANYEDYNNELVGGINGIQSDSTGTTNVIADNNNIIAGTENGILSDGAGTITVTAENNNTIGKGVDENSNQIDSINGITVTNGTVTVIAGNQNSIYGTKTGITADGDVNKTIDSNVILNGKTTYIEAKNTGEDVTGIYAIHGAEVNLNKGKQTNASVAIKAISTDGEAVGIDAGYDRGEAEGNGGKILNTNLIGDMNIIAQSTNGSATGINASYYSDINLNVKSLTVNAFNDSNDSVKGISLNPTSKVNITSDSNIEINAKSSSGKDSTGLYVGDHNSGPDSNVMTIKSTNGNIIINNIYNDKGEKDLVELKKSAIGIRTGTKGDVSLEAKNISISGKTGILTYNSRTTLDIKSEGINDITALNKGIDVAQNSTVNLDGKVNNITLFADKDNLSMVKGVVVGKNGTVNIGTDSSILSETTNIIVNSNKKIVLYLPLKQLQEM